MFQWDPTSGRFVDFRGREPVEHKKINDYHGRRSHCELIIEKLNENYTNANVSFKETHSMMYSRTQLIHSTSPTTSTKANDMTGNREMTYPTTTYYTRVWVKIEWPTRKRIRTLRRAIRRGTAVAGSDVSLKYGNGEAGWKLTVSKGRLSIMKIQKGAAPVESAPEEQSSPRC